MDANYENIKSDADVIKVLQDINNRFDEINVNNVNSFESQIDNNLNKMTPYVNFNVNADAMQLLSKIRKKITEVRSEQSGGRKSRRSRRSRKSRKSRKLRKSRKSRKSRK